MQKVLDEIARLTEKHAVHRKGFMLDLIHLDVVLDHADEELWELIDAFDGNYSDTEQLHEFADLLCCLHHFAIRKGWSLEQIEDACLEKLRLRFSIPNG